MRPILRTEFDGTCGAPNIWLRGAAICRGALLLPLLDAALTDPHSLHLRALQVSANSQGTCIELF